jgi:hypothetical protein
MQFVPHPADRPWHKRFSKMLGLLDDAPQVGTQLAVIQRDDVDAPMARYKPCPRRGTHESLVECWMCHNDVAWGYAKPKDVLRARSRR